LYVAVVVGQTPLTTLTELEKSGTEKGCPGGLEVRVSGLGQFHRHTALYQPAWLCSRFSAPACGADEWLDWWLEKVGEVGIDGVLISAPAVADRRDEDGSADGTPVRNGGGGDLVDLSLTRERATVADDNHCLWELGSFF
jgi:hypothetical protein